MKTIRELEGDRDKILLHLYFPCHFSLAFMRNFMRPRRSDKVIKTKRKRNSLWRESNHTRDKSVLHERQHLDNKHFMAAF